MLQAFDVDVRILATQGALLVTTYILFYSLAGLGLLLTKEVSTEVIQVRCFFRYR